MQWKTLSDQAFGFAVPWREKNSPLSRLKTKNRLGSRGKGSHLPPTLRLNHLFTRTTGNGRQNGSVYDRGRVKQHFVAIEKLRITALAAAESTKEEKNGIEQPWLKGTWLSVYE